MDLTSEMSNFNKVKEIVLSKLVDEGLLDKVDADEFGERCQVLMYKGKWFRKWFDKNIKADAPESDENAYYIRIIELKEREDEVDKLLRRTTGDYDD